MYAVLLTKLMRCVLPVLAGLVGGYFTGIWSVDETVVITRYHQGIGTYYAHEAETARQFARSGKLDAAADRLDSLLVSLLKDPSVAADKSKRLKYKFWGSADMDELRGNEILRQKMITRLVDSGYGKNIFATVEIKQARDPLTPEYTSQSRYWAELVKNALAKSSQEKNN